MQKFILTKDELNQIVETTKSIIKDNCFNCSNCANCLRDDEDKPRCYQKYKKRGQLIDSFYLISKYTMCDFKHFEVQLNALNFNIYDVLAKIERDKK